MLGPFGLITAITAFDPDLYKASRRIEVFERLQNHTAPETFTPKVIYDGDKIAYASRVLPFGESQSVSQPHSTAMRRYSKVPYSFRSTCPIAAPVSVITPSL